MKKKRSESLQLCHPRIQTYENIRLQLVALSQVVLESALGRTRHADTSWQFETLDLNRILLSSPFSVTSRSVRTVLDLFLLRVC